MNKWKRTELKKGRKEKKRKEKKDEVSSRVNTTEERNNR